MELFTDIYTRDKNSKQVMMEPITTDRGEFHFKDDDQETDVGKHLNRVHDIIQYIDYLQGEPDQLTEGQEINLFFKTFKIDW